MAANGLLSVPLSLFLGFIYVSLSFELSPCESPTETLPLLLKPPRPPTDCKKTEKTLTCFHCFMYVYVSGGTQIRGYESITAGGFSVSMFLFRLLFLLLLHSYGCLKIRGRVSFIKCYMLRLHRGGWTFYSMWVHNEKKDLID